jgi:hypothetical protein
MSERKAARPPTTVRPPQRHLYPILRPCPFGPGRGVFEVLEGWAHQAQGKRSPVGIAGRQ